MSENKAVPVGTVAPIERITIDVPIAIAGLLRGLTERTAALLGESPEACRRAVEITVLTRGCYAVSDELKELAAQSAKMGWPR
jgi:hypothetical protein